MLLGQANRMNTYFPAVDLSVVGRGVSMGFMLDSTFSHLETSFFEGRPFDSRVRKEK